MASISLGIRSFSLMNSSSWDKISLSQSSRSSDIALTKSASSKPSRPSQFEIAEAWHPADRALQGVGLAVGASDDPLQDPHVLAEARPDELAVLVAAEPVHAEDAGRVGDVAAELEPVVEVVRHVIAREGQHRERVAANHALLAERRRGGLRTHRRGQVHAVGPVERLVHQRHRPGPAAAEHERD